MSDLRPVGAKVNFDGVEREFLFTLNVIEELEDFFEKPVYEILKDTVSMKDQKTIRKVVQVLVNNDIEKQNLVNNEKQQPVTERYIGMFLTRDREGGNVIGMVEKIMEAYKISMPAAGDNDPNR